MKKLKEKIIALLKLNNSPTEIALGVAIGCFISILPLYGFHTLLCVLFALMIPHANKIAILVGTNVSLPPTLPFITWGGYSIGRALLGDKYPPMGWEMFKSFSRRSIFDFYYPLFVGSVVLGLGCALVLYFATFFIFKYRRRKRENA